MNGLEALARLQNIMKSFKILDLCSGRCDWCCYPHRPRGQERSEYTCICDAEPCGHHWCPAKMETHRTDARIPTQR
jgi:hypothetical protein